MFVKQRQVKSSRFTSKFGRASTRPREAAASIYAMGVVQGLLVVFLLVGMVQSYGLMRDKFPDLAWYVRLGVPLGVLVVAAIIFRAFIGTLRWGMAVQREAKRPSRPKNLDQ